MPDRTYQLDTVAPSAAKFVSDMDRIIAKLREMDALCDQVKPKLSGIGAGAGRSLGALARSLDGVAASGKAANTALAGTAAATTDLKTAAAGARAHTSELGVSLGELVGFRLGMTALHLAIKTFADAMNEAREYSVKTAEALLKINDDVRELRAIMGDKTSTREATAAVAERIKASGATVQEARSFKTIWESTLPAAKQNVDEATGKSNWQLSDKDTADVEQEALKFAISQGIDPATVGRMVASIGISQPVKTKADVMAQLSAMHSLAVQGVGTFTPIMQAYNKLRPTMVNPKGGGAAVSSAELLGIISAETVNVGNVPRVVQNIQQVWRDLSFADNKEKEATFAKYGLKPGDDYVTRVEKIAPLIAEAEARGVEPLQALKEAGFGRLGSNPKLIADVRNRSVLRARVNAAKTAADPNRVEALNAQFRAENPDRFAKAADTAADMVRGQELRTLLSMRTSVQAGLKLNKEIETPGANALETLRDITSLGGMLGEKGRPSHLDAEIRARLRASVPDVVNRFPALNPKLTQEGAQPEGEELSRIIDSLSADDKARLQKELNRFQETGVRGTARGGGLPGLGGVGPQASNGDLSPLIDINREQLRVLERIERGAGNGAGVGPVAFGEGLPLDGGDFGPRRAGA
jgi:hypothetical protein